MVAFFLLEPGICVSSLLFSSSSSIFFFPKLSHLILSSSPPSHLTAGCQAICRRCPSPSSPPQKAISISPLDLASIIHTTASHFLVTATSPSSPIDQSSQLPPQSAHRQASLLPPGQIHRPLSTHSQIRRPTSSPTVHGRHSSSPMASASLDPAPLLFVSSLSGRVADAAPLHTIAAKPLHLPLRPLLYPRAHPCRPTSRSTPHGRLSPFCRRRHARCGTTTRSAALPFHRLQSPSRAVHRCSSPCCHTAIYRRPAAVTTEPLLPTPNRPFSLLQIQLPQRIRVPAGVSADASDQKLLRAPDCAPRRC